MEQHNKTNRLNIRVSKRLFIKIEKISKDFGFSNSEVVRRCLENCLTTRKEGGSKFNENQNTCPKCGKYVTFNDLDFDNKYSKKIEYCKPCSLKFQIDIIKSDILFHERNKKDSDKLIIKKLCELNSAKLKLKEIDAL